MQTGKKNQNSNFQNDTSVSEFLEDEAFNRDYLVENFNQLKNKGNSISKLNNS